MGVRSATQYLTPRNVQRNVRACEILHNCQQPKSEGARRKQPSPGADVAAVTLRDASLWQHGRAGGRVGWGGRRGVVPETTEVWRLRPVRGKERQMVRDGAHVADAHHLVAAAVQSTKAVPPHSHCAR
jgi:tRNA A37 N6-isopentenylltransferase MiaA